MANTETISFGSLGLDDSDRFNRIADLAYEANTEIAPNGGGFDDVAFYRELPYVFIDYLEVDGTVAAYITSRSHFLGEGENRTQIPMVEAVTSREHRGKGYRKQLLHYLLEKDKGPGFGLHTWRVDTVIGDTLPTEYPETERATHDIAQVIIKDEPIDPAEHMEEIGKIARVVKADDANSELGFRLVKKANGDRDPHLNYLFLRPESGKTLPMLGMQLNEEGMERLGKLRQFLINLQQPEIYQAPSPHVAGV